MLSRIERLNPRMHAFIEIDRDGALAAAAISDQRYADDNQRPLEGITVGIKANIAVAGLEHNAGMGARHGLIAAQDAEVVKKLRDAGMVVLGTLNMHEAALGGTTDNPFFGCCLNPHGEGLTAGGSSGGSAAAVAAGLCTVALGTDTLGSVRIPASYCGIFGLKPGNSAIRHDGLVPLSPPLDSIGLLARSMDDISFLSNIIVAPDLSSAMQRARYLTIEDMGGVGLEPAVATAYAHALTMLPQVPTEFALDVACKRLRIAGFAQATRDLAVELVALGEERCSQISEDVARKIEFGLSRTEAELSEDASIMARARALIYSQVDTNGIIVLPTAPQHAFPLDNRAPNNQADFTCLANIAGLPSISIPIGRSTELLPIGMQLIGPEGGEALLVAQARSINDRLKAYAPPINWW
jgi:aspartyl-tRNA(Asn)/glutamyl-tRNA(Gln) amidotransferase subunit A